MSDIFRKQPAPPVPPRPKKHQQRSASIEVAELEVLSSESLTSSINSEDTRTQEDSEGIQGAEPSATPPERRKVDLKKPRVTRAFELSRAAAAKKMLTSEQNAGPQTFKRGTAISKSRNRQTTPRAVARRGGRGGGPAVALGAPPQTPGRLRRKSEAGGSAPDPGGFAARAKLGAPPQARSRRSSKRHGSPAPPPPGYGPDTHNGSR